MLIGSSLVFVGLVLAAPQERRPVDVPSTHTVTARVVDARGNPVAHAHVKAEVEPADGSKRVHRGGATDAEGVLRFEDLPTGVLELRQNDFNGGGGPKAGVSLKADFEQTFRIHGYLSLSGRIVGNVGSDPWLTLEAYREIFGDDFVRRVPLREDGRFAFSGLEPGRYQLSVRRGRRYLFADVIFATEFDLYESRASQELHVPSLGSVEFDFAGRGERPGLVSAYLESEGDSLQRGYITHRDRITMLPYGRYCVRIHEKLESRYGHRLLRDVTFDLAEPEKKVTIDVSLLAVWARFSASELPARGIQGRLRLTDSSGHVLEDQEWRLSHERDGHGLEVDEVYYGQIGTGIRSPGDRLELVGLAPGPWSLEVEAAGYAPLQVEFDAESEAVVDVDLERRPGRVVRARVGDRRYEIFVRQAASDALWELLLWDAGVRVTHRAPVGVSHGHLEPGTYEFRLHSRKFAEELVGPIEIGDAIEPLVIPFSPAQGHVLRGRLFLDPGVPVEATLHVWRREEGSWEARPTKRVRASVGLDPHFTIPGLLPGRYRLTLDPAGVHEVGEFTMGDADGALDLVLDN